MFPGRMQPGARYLSGARGPKTLVLAGQTSSSEHAGVTSAGNRTSVRFRAGEPKGRCTLSLDTDEAFCHARQQLVIDSAKDNA
ncbi:hypothetical protein ZHAS_00020909 [Anopheles sinensis]|uniref:Uncharacterized protein n=1 Tax=Anopheles sinensis TaxID=74873 RepID=A0A084WR11_ANOSI|nr:hypothetical protein ZHAS_00020909 [Anopheles sinensis]